ncbi:hypothetical protein LTR53_009293 [Teratosphaeriaceae sp. CCFEE 6253]|nr:hypothetical protein LTR53_009293 [Teratosphaeriaceae sp. CCFEE 6253]
MPYRYLSRRNAILAFLIAYILIPIPSGFGTDEVIAATGLVRTLTALCDYIGLPEERRRFASHFRYTVLPYVEEPEEHSDGTNPLPSHVTTRRLPTYFLSHGGPNVMYETDHPAYAELQKIGLEITQQNKPKAVVVFSAHWQAEPNVIEINTAVHTDMIYDFSGFPPHYYEVQWPHKGSPQLAERLIQMLGDAGVKAKGVTRGPDHGVWAGFMVAFNPKTNPLTVPVVQVSLFDSEDADQHYRLGQAVSALRDEGVQIICTGMSVHNLRDFQRMRMMGATAGEPSYTETFDDALKHAAETAPEDRQKAMRTLLGTPLAREAHPTFDHILPVHVAAGAAGNDSGKQLWTMAEGSLAWGQFRFGEVGA